MKVKRFVPGHISCVFRPVRTGDVRTTGSLGLGIRLDKGCTATVWETSGNDISICINGSVCEASVTRAAIESMHPDTGLEIRLMHDLPLEQGFAASASGTLAAALCVADLLGRDVSEAFSVTHIAECSMGGGLGDLAAIRSGYDVPVRRSAGVDAEVTDPGIRFDHLSLLVSDEPLRTTSVLNDDAVMKKVIRYGDEAMGMFTSDPTVGTLFKASNMFSEGIGLESERIRSARAVIGDEGYRSGMCMLGNSIYTDAPVDYLRERFPDSTVIGCASFGGKITQKA